MTFAQKCLALTAALLVVIVAPVAAISAFTLPLFGSSNQDVQQVSLDGASLQEETNNGVTSGTCSYEDDSGRTIEVTYTKDEYGRVNARSRSFGVSNPDAAYRACLQKVEELKRKELEAAGVYDEGVTQPPISNAQATTLTQTPVSNPQATTSSPFPSLSGSASQTPSRNPGQIQMVFQTSHGNSVQFQENSNGGATSGQCSYVDVLGRTIRISYTKHADGRVDVVTEPQVWRPKSAYRTCINKARKEEERLNSEMANIEAEMRQQEQEIQSEMARQEQEAFGRGG